VSTLRWMSPEEMFALVPPEEPATAEDGTEPGPAISGSRKANGEAPEDNEDGAAEPEEPSTVREAFVAHDRNVAHPRVGPVAVRHEVVIVDFPAFVSETADEPEEEWLVDGLVPADGLTILGGDPKTGKTLFALDLGFAVASGGRFLDRDTAQASFLYVTEEGSPAEMRKRVKRLLESRPPTLPTRLAYRQGVRFDDELTWAEIRAEVDRLPKPALIVLDPLRELILGDENDSATINGVGRAVRSLLADFAGVTVVLLHHLSKRRDIGGNGGHRLRGSSALWGAADCTLLFIGTPPDDDTDGEVVLRGKVFVEPRNAPKATLSWVWDVATGLFVPADSAGGPLADRAFDHLLVAGPTTTNRLAQVLDTTPGSVRTTLTRPAHRARFRAVLNTTEAERTDPEDKSQVWQAVVGEEEGDEVFGS
jgi:AAA domain-containing protein